jgi:hypothetical protein
MKITGQVLASTHLDSQGEKLTKHELEHFVAKSPTKFVLHSNHDITNPILGIAQNLRLVACDDGENWQIVADIETDESEAFRSFGGMSISFLTELHRSETAVFSIALPYPLYNDSNFTSALHSSSGANIMKWRKKGDSLEQVAIIVTLGVFVLGPPWQHFYSKVIAPEIDRLAKSALPQLRAKNLRVEFSQRLKFDNRIVDLRFFADRENQPKLLDNSSLIDAIQQAEELLKSQTANTGQIIQILIFQYDRIGRRFRLQRVENSNGTYFDF